VYQFIHLSIKTDIFTMKSMKDMKLLIVDLHVLHALHGEENPKDIFPM